MTFPENLKYTKDHEWLRVEGNEGFVGITDFAQGELGDVVFVEVDVWVEVVVCVEVDVMLEVDVAVDVVDAVDVVVFVEVDV